MHSRCAAASLTPFAFPAPCDNQQHGLTLSHRCLVPLGDGEWSPHPPVCFGGRAQEACSDPASFQGSGSATRAHTAEEGDRMELGELEAAGSSTGSVANPHKCCQRSGFDNESITCHKQLQSQLPPLPILQRVPRNRMEGVSVAVTHQGCPQ